jgi:hypothetical protein
VSVGPAAAILAGLRAAHPGWTIGAHPMGLGLWTAEHRSTDGHAIHYIVCRTSGELAAKLEEAGREDRL